MYVITLHINSIFFLKTVYVHCTFYLSKVFFDELNTSSCMGVLKEIITDRSIEGDVCVNIVLLVET